MTSKSKELSVVDAELTILESKRNAIYEYFQETYDEFKDLQSSDKSAIESFLGATSNIEKLRSEFTEVLDNYNKRLLSVNPSAKPNYKSLISLEQLYSRIKCLRSQYSTQINTTSLTRNVPSLPPIQLVAFDGDIRSWPIFYASFRSTIHENSSLSDSDKLYYLLGKISGKAKTACAGITPSAENYNLILQTLIDKYEDKRMLASTYINQIFEFKPLTSASVDSFDNFLDNFVTAVRALNNLKLENLSDLIILQIALKKLDHETIRSFEMENSSTAIPSFNKLVDFLTNQSKILQRNATSSSTTKRVDSSTKKRSSIYPKIQTFVSTLDNIKCLCKNFTHSHLYKCISFNNMSPEIRFKTAKEHNACVNCLSLKHKTSACNSNSHCVMCKQKHHSLLHFNSNLLPKVNSSSASAVGNNSQKNISDESMNKNTHVPGLSDRTDVSLCSTSMLAPRTSIVHAASAAPRDECRTVLLATAQVIIYDGAGRTHTIRCLLDSGSQCNFITTECFNRLGITYEEGFRVVKGIGGFEQIIKGSVNLTFYSRFNKKVKFDIDALVVDCVTGSLPTAYVNLTALPHLEGLPLADVTFAQPGPIDMLIGAAVYPHLLLPNVVTSHNSGPVAVETILGYIVMGSVPTLSIPYSTHITACCSLVTDEPIDGLVKKFWELEEVAQIQPQRQCDIECEEFYRATTTRDPSSGRYTVALPFCEDVYCLSDSYEAALKRFICLERKLEASPKLRFVYDQVINDYINQGYLSPAPTDDSSVPVYVIPHHGVIREDKNTTKLRVVLDASCKTKSGISLNDILHSGKNLQGDLFKIILNFRLYAVALTADCKQMFLQIGMQETDRRFQRILYRFSPSKPVCLYQFNRVCFGLKSSPFHALRTVQQLIEDDGGQYPYAVSVLSTSLYMDDVVFSEKNEQQAANLAHDLIHLFKGAQLDLVKWTSNSSYALQSLPVSHRSDVEFDKSVQHKILGLHWSTNTDSFHFSVTPPGEKCTKRSILSTIARLWDIMGFVAPVILRAKLLIKQLWQIRVDWDDVPPPHIVRQWKQFCIELPCLNKLRIPRHLGVTENCAITFLGFSDASEHAYGGVVYIHVSSSSGNIVRLVCAKSKVAPMKPISIARLELCAAVLLSQLLRNVVDTYSSRCASNIYAFTDSKIVLYWIKSSPHRWQTFVANRVVKLTDNTSPNNFYHVSGTDNPADCLSRGLTPSKLISHPLWYNGPPWAVLDPSQWPLKDIDQIPDEVAEAKIAAFPVFSIEGDESVILSLASRMSSWSKLLRTLVYAFRFLKILPRRGTLSITASDLEIVENKLLKELQLRYFRNDLSNLHDGLNCTSVLVKLRPFLCDGLIRVGGRLTNSNLLYNQKHPIILPRHDHVIDLLIDYYHQKYLHAGPELLLSLLRQKFWILSARRIVRQRVHRCNTCFKSNPRPTYPLMADLPNARVRQVTKAFVHTGCDYAGPISYTPIRRRGARVYKAYLCVFTCLTTRAVHIECTTDLSTASFISALKRFLSRRGPVSILYSDNGTNFVGSNTYLKELYNFLNNEFRPRFEEELTESRIKWKFIPPASPHFGGCWESMVKIIKSHLFKVIGKQLLSYEELVTVLTQIECILNSRPLTVLSSDPSEPTALTPSHFLNTTPLLSLPSPEVENISLVHRYTLLDKLVQSFWKRWRLEYLHGLQIREKWNTSTVPIALGTVVVIITDNVPPLSWPLGIVHALHPSKDGTIRVASVRTAKGTFLRPVVRLCPLPNQ